MIAHWRLLKADLQRWVIPSFIAAPDEITPLMVLRLWIRYKQVRALFWFRLAGFARARRVPLLTGIALRWMYSAYGFEIEPGGRIAGGLYVAHTNGTVINAEEIGRNCSIISNVTIGLHKGHERPRIGNDVFIGAGARVLGDITIGDGARIGANAVVLKDVPAGATAVGVPARILLPREAGGLQPPPDRVPT